MTRGDIFMLDFGVPFRSEPGYRRPVVIVQAEKENLNNLNTTIVVPLTSNTVYADEKAMFFFLKQYPNYQKIPLPLSTKSSQLINSGLEKKFQVSQTTLFLK